MKKYLLFIAILFTLFGFSQPITVDTSTYTVPQLVNDILINSSCVSATNISWSTGSNFSSTNGIGYFQNTNPNFPIPSGVILSTGNVPHAAGPNSSLLSDGSQNWPGDTNLENTMAAAGISLVSKNATVLEFDFTPISSSFSFDFIFASEEYGNFQCQFSDAFAFLLTNVNTGVTTNLAVVPGTNLPISVVTIRDFLYNSSCPSANAQYFGSFNGGSAANGSATNFNGQTRIMTASSVLTPNVPYHIKLVIADRIDPQNDSAIFLSSDSFNIGQDVLGQDLTVANNNAICFGDTKTLNSGLDPLVYSFIWKKNNVVIAGATGPSLVVNQPGTYSLTYTNLVTICNPTTDTIVVEYFPKIVTPNPKTIYKCDTGAATYTFNLDINTPIVIQGLDPLTQVTYFSNQNDATTNTNALPLLYNSAPGQLVYVRVQPPNRPCFVIKSFLLQVTPAPIANQPPNLIRCAPSILTNSAYFNLAQQTPLVLNGQSNQTNVVTYYASLANAINGNNPLTNLTSYASTGTTNYVRVQNATDPTCYSLTSFNLIVNPAPDVDVLDNVIVCTSYTLQPLINGNYFTGPNGTGTPMFAGDIITETQVVYIFNQPNGPNTCAANSSFLVTIIDPTLITPTDVVNCGTYHLPSLANGDYYTEAGGLGTHLLPGTPISSTQVVHFYLVTTIEPICTVDTSFNVSILDTIDVGQRPNVFECSSYTLPPLTIGNYYTGPNGSGNIVPEGTVITTSQQIYVYAVASNGICKSEDSFYIIIGYDQPTDIAQCNGYTLPHLMLGNYYTQPMGGGQLLTEGTVINQSSTIYIYVPTTSGTNNCTDNMHFSVTIAQPNVDNVANVNACVTYTLPPLTNGDYYTGTNGTGTQLHAGDIIQNTQTLYVYKQISESCSNQSSFTVTINPLPNIDNRADIDICNQYVLTNLGVGNYYTGSNATGTLLPGGTVITTSQKIYIYATIPNLQGCSIENSFQINVYSTQADALQNVTTCDAYTLPTLTANNKYYTQSGGPYGTGVEIQPGTVITTTQTIYIYKEAFIRTSFTCSDEKSFVVTINHTPVAPSLPDVNVCYSYTLPPLPAGNDYYTGSGGTGIMMHAGDVLTTSKTLFVYAHTGTNPDCWNETSFVITIFMVDVLVDVNICQSYVLPPLSVGKYYTAPNGTGNILPAGSVITNTRTLYIYATSPFNPTCAVQSSFNITVIPTPVAHTVPASVRTVCDMDGTNDGVTSFNLASLNATVLGNQTGSQFNIAYYNTLEEASDEVNAITSTSGTVVYVRVNNTLAPSCYDVQAITIIVNKLPEPKPLDGVVCIESKTGHLINPYIISSGLNGGNYHYTWTNEAGATVGTSSTYTAVLPGTYNLVATSLATGCSSVPTPAHVIPSEPASVTYTVDSEFEDHQNLNIIAVGQGNNFEYSLDDGPFQDSPIFINTLSGLHYVTVRDKYGCGSTTIAAIVVNYPKFFTPNGDGINDTWNIRDLSNQPDANIYIYDRYGKILKQIRPSNSGWDGTYNGAMMPSDDYWFSVTYSDESHNEREFKAHFAMKR